MTLLNGQQSRRLPEIALSETRQLQERLVSLLVTTMTNTLTLPTPNWEDDDDVLWAPAKREALEAAQRDTEAASARERAERQAIWEEYERNNPPLPSDVFTSDPFGTTGLPACHYLDPDGGPLLAALYKPKWSPSWKHYAKHAPNSLAVARSLYYSLAAIDIYGQQISRKDWRRCIAGRLAAGKGFMQKQMPLSLIIGALGNPNRFAAGNSDERVERDYCVEPTRVSHLRIDVDMNDVWWDCDQEALTQELQHETAICNTLGLTPHFFRTGGRGHQIVIPTPRIHRSVAGLALLMLRYLLVSTPCQRAVIDKNNLESLMRLPLGRHADTLNVAWMLDGKTGLVIPLDRQAQAVEEAFVYQEQGCDLLAACADDLAQSLNAIGYAPDHNVLAGTKLKDKARWAVLEDIVMKLPPSAFLEAFLRTRNRLRAERRAMLDLTRQTDVELTHAQADDGAQEDLYRATEEDSREKPISPLKAGRKVGKGWANSIIDGSFQPGDFYRWSRADGDNGIGAAIIVCDGDKDRAEKLLIDMANEVAGSEADKASRINWIQWAVPRNNTDVRYQQMAPLADHKEFNGGYPSAEETAIAQQAIEVLVQRRAASDARKKVFPAKALVTIRHIIELVLVSVRQADSYTVEISARTLLAAVRSIWPDDATSLIDVQRQFKHIVASEGCLFGVVEPLGKLHAFAANRYALCDSIIGSLSPL